MKLLDTRSNLRNLHNMTPREDAGSAVDRFEEPGRGVLLGEVVDKKKRRQDRSKQLLKLLTVATMLDFLLSSIYLRSCQSFPPGIS